MPLIPSDSSLTRRRLIASTMLTLPLGGAVRAASDLDRRIRARMQRFVDQGDVPGVVALAGARSGVTTLVALGHRNLVGGAMKGDTLFRIASMTKPITAVAVMQLTENGQLSVDDPVEKHLPEFKGQMLVRSRDGAQVVLAPPSRTIRIRDLLTHTSGLPGSPPPGLSDLYARRHLSLAEAVMAFSQRPLDFEPGTRWSYCNTGIDTLGRVVEVVSGQGFEAYLDQHVFRPLGMRDTYFYPTRQSASREAQILNKVDGKLAAVPAPLVGSGVGARYPIPAGGLLSTAPDLARLYRAMLGGGELDGVRILSQATVREMTSLQTGKLVTGFVPGMGFGFGWAHVREPQGVTAMLSPGTYGHGGAFGTQGWIDPVKDRFAILMIARTGLANGDASDLRRDLQAEVWA